MSSCLHKFRRSRFLVHFAAQTAIAITISTSPQLSSVANATETDFQSPTLVLRLERVPSCRTCSSFQYLVYSDMTHKYVGREGVFHIGDHGSFDEFQAYRTATVGPTRTETEVRVARQRYGDRVLHANNPGSPLRTTMDAVEKTGIFQLDSSAPPTRTPGRSNSLRLEARWNGKHVSVEHREDSLPPQMRHAITEMFRTNAWLQYAIQETPAFWGDDDAELLVHERRFNHECKITSSLVLHRSGKVSIFGWNDLGVGRQFQLRVRNVGPQRVSYVFAGFDRGMKTKDSTHRTASILISVGIGNRDTDTTHVLFYKSNLNALDGVPQDSWKELATLWTESRAQLGPNDPGVASRCQRRFVR